MAKSDRPANLLHKPSFEDGVDAPAEWEWVIHSGTPMWRFDETTVCGGGRSLQILQDVGKVHGVFRQRVAAKPRARYRLSGRIRVANEGTGDNSGANMSLASLKGSEAIEEMGLRPFFVGREEWQLWTAEYVTAAGADGLEVSFDMRNSSGAAWFDALELIEVPEPYERSGHFAEPRPAMASAPMRATSIRLCLGAPARFLVSEVIEPLFGGTGVTVAPLRKAINDVQDDALVLYSTTARRVVDLAALETLARDRLVIMTLEVFAAALDRGAGRVQTVRRTGAAPCARIETTSFITRGFRRGDVVPWWTDRDGSGIFSQRRLKVPPGLLAGLGYETVVSGVCGAPKDDGLPVVLWKQVGRGSVLVMDLESLDSRPRYGAPATPALVMLSNALGRPQTLMGTWVVPGFDYERFADDLQTLAARHKGLAVREEGRTPEGRPILSLSLGEEEKPAFFADAGIHPYEWAPCFGLPLYMTRLADEYEKGLPWARAILSKMRVKCVPVVGPAGWAANAGVVRGVNLNRNFPVYWDEHKGADKGRAPLSEPETQTIARILREDNVAAAVNWHETSANTNWVGMPGYGGAYEPFATAIPAVFRQFIDGDHFSWQAAVWSQVTDPRNFHYHYADSFPYLRDYSLSRSPFLLHYSASLGITSFLVEQYGNSEIYHSASPQRTDMTCRIFEMLLGLRAGLVCRNSSGETVNAAVPLHTRDENAEAIVYSASGEVLERRRLAPREGRAVAEGAVPPGGCLVAEPADAPWTQGRRKAE
jgi:hypothetical protein